MNDSGYYWINRASKHHIDKLRILLSDLPNDDEILSSGIPRYIRYFVDEEESEDGHRLYQFLIEYDIYNPSQGIYFGCKSVTREGYCHEIEVKKALSDWHALRYMTTLRLNNIFPDIDFTYRYKDTDNVSHHTFWPFWIELYEVDSLTDFAIPALRMIADVYRDKSARHHVCSNKDIEISSPPVFTAFTSQAFVDFKMSILNNVKIKTISSI